MVSYALKNVLVGPAVDGLAPSDKRRCTRSQPAAAAAGASASRSYTVVLESWQYAWTPPREGACITVVGYAARVYPKTGPPQELLFRGTDVPQVLALSQAPDVVVASASLVTEALGAASLLLVSVTVNGRSPQQVTDQVSSAEVACSIPVLPTVASGTCINTCSARKSPAGQASTPFNA